MSGASEVEFPILCENCLGPNPYIRMLQEPHGAACKVCERPYTVFMWKPEGGRPKRTVLCRVCAKMKNVCQTCILDLQYNLPVQVRDAGLDASAKLKVPSSQVSLHWMAEQHDRMVQHHGEHGASSALQSSGNVVSPFFGVGAGRPGVAAAAALASAGVQSVMRPPPGIASSKAASSASANGSSSNSNSNSNNSNNNAGGRYGKAPIAPNNIVRKLARTEPYYKRNLSKICSFFVRGTCNRGDKCPYRHEMPSESSLTKEMRTQKYKDRYFGVNDPVARKMLQSLNRPREAPKPPADKTIKTLWLGGVTPNISQNDLQREFSQYGDVLSVKCFYQKSFAFVEMGTRAMAEDAVTGSWLDLKINGVSVDVRWSHSSPAQRQAARAAAESSAASSSGSAKGAIPHSQRQQTGTDRYAHAQLQVPSADVQGLDDTSSATTASSSLATTTTTTTTATAAADAAKAAKKRQLQALLQSMPPPPGIKPKHKQQQQQYYPSMDPRQMGAKLQ